MLTTLARRGRFTSLLLAGVLVVDAACAEPRAHVGDDSSAGGDVGEDPEAALRAQRGRTWELARLGDQEIPMPRAGSAPRPPGRHPGPGSRPTIRFTAESAGALARDSTTPGAGGWSFCNGYGTAYELGPGHQLRFHGFQSTLVGCDGPDSLESRFFRALGATRRFAIDSDTLVLIAADGSRLTFVVAPDSAGPPSTR